MTTDNKWYAVRTVAEHINEEKWRIVDQSADNVLNPIDVGQQEAERNAKLCAAAPEMRQLLEEMLEDLKNAADWYGEGPYPIDIEYYENKIKQLQ